MQMAKAIEMRPIGWVHSAITTTKDDCWGDLVVAIELDVNVYSADSLQGLNEFSHAEILFHFDRISPDRIHTGTRHPRGRTDWPKIGIFAQRGRERPNRIGLSTCRIVRVQGTQLLVAELDAIEGTPVLDIKPYMAEFGPRDTVRQPAWSRELMAGYYSPAQPRDKA
jgi:tRNA-Thr(GGU) m(6)t(6)A37 methyltransferase TsaA